MRVSTRALFGVLLGLLAISIFVLWHTWERQEYALSIAGGQRSAQIFQLVKAIQTVAERHYPELRIEVFETRGSLQNIRLLERGAVHLAAAQADLIAGRRARLVAELYSDVFQLVVRRDSGINDIGDLVDKRIALPPEKSGEYESFWFLASHYDLNRKDIEAFPGTEKTTDWLFINGDVDALFRVRSPGDQSISKLFDKVGARLIAIPQASALRLKQPALDVGVIPKGSYNGRPAIPATELTVVSVKQLLVAREDIPDDAIRKLTSVLFERRRELIEAIPLAGSISVPDRTGGTFLPIHPGAQAFYDRDQPWFLQENAEPIALLVSVVFILMSAYLQLVTRRRKRVMGAYNRELLELAQRARAVASFSELDECDMQLAEFVGRIVGAAEDGQINAHEFNLFTFTYEAVEDAIRDREAQLERSYKRDHVDKGGRRSDKPPRRTAKIRSNSDE